MKILYIEDNKEIINIINEKCNNSNNEIILIDNPKDALIIFENSLDSIDLIVTELDFPDTNYILYLNEIRRLKKNIPIVITSNVALDNSILEFINIGIKKILRKPFNINELEEVIFEIKHSILANKEIKKLKKEQLNLETENKELSSVLKPFKEFSYYSQTDLSGVIIEISDSFCEVIGYKKEELIGKKHSIIKHPLEDKRKYKEIWKRISLGENWIGELRCLDKYKDDIWYKIMISPKKDKNNNIIGYCANRQDITEKKYMELLSITNDLTGLYNKRFFKQTFQSELNRSKRAEKNLVFIMIDIDYFKKYNDKYGHLKGDDVLKQIADVLKQMTKRVNDFAFRLGGEEFGIITSNLEEKKIIQYAENIKKSIKKLNITHENSSFGYITASIGVYNSELNDDKQYNEIYALADKLLYISKEKGRNQISYNF